MKVFVTGASGFVGREVLQKLHDAGHRIRILARYSNSASVRAAIADFGVEVHAGDILYPASLEAGLKDIDAVIHLVGIISEMGKSTFENVHVRGTENIVTAAKNSGVRRLGHMSALGTRPDAVARYHKTKWQAEEIVRRSELDYTIFRPSIIYGPRDHFVNLFATISKFSPMLPIIGGGQSKLQPVPVSDVAACFVRALTEPRSIGQTYDLCGADVLSFENILEEILRVTGRKRLKMHLPVNFSRGLAAFLEFYFPLVANKAPPLNRDQIIMLDEDNVGSAQPANELFGLKPIPFREGISAYLKHA